MFNPMAHAHLALAAVGLCGTKDQEELSEKPADVRTTALEAHTAATQCMVICNVCKTAAAPSEPREPRHPLWGEAPIRKVVTSSISC